MLSKGRGVKEMLEAIRVAAGCKATGDCKATGRAVVIPKNSEKCSMIVNCKERNHVGGVKPKGFRPPQVARPHGFSMPGDWGGRCVSWI